MEGRSFRKKCSHSNVFLTLLIALLFCSAANTLSTETNTDFIKRSCKATTYPQVCFDSLANYATAVKASHRKLAHAALTVSLMSARSTASMVSKLSGQYGLSPYEGQVLRECVEEIGNSIDELQQSLKAMSRLSGLDVDFQMSNINTWVSAALTNEDTCMDDLGAKAMNLTLKNKIRSDIHDLAKLTSNALALINHLPESKSGQQN